MAKVKIVKRKKKRVKAKTTKSTAASGRNVTTVKRTKPKKPIVEMLTKLFVCPRCRKQYFAEVEATWSTLLIYDRFDKSALIQYCAECNLTTTAGQFDAKHSK